jgi:integrase
VSDQAHTVVAGKTPEISARQDRDLLPWLDPSPLVGLRDRAIIAVLVYTAARVGAVARLTAKSLKHNERQYALRFSEKGGKSREIPVRHDVEQIHRPPAQSWDQLDELLPDAWFALDLQSAGQRPELAPG